MAAPSRLTSLWNMHRLNAAAFLNVQHYLGYWIKVLRDRRQVDANNGIVSVTNPDGKVHDDYDKFFEDLRGMDLPMSVLSAQRLHALVQQSSPTSELTAALYDLQARVKDELSIRYVFSLTQAEQQFIEPTAPLFGNDVAAKFSSLAYDIEQGGKCFGFGLSTAAAFHFIRSLEGCITALSRCLGIPDPTKGAQRNWGALLTALKKEMDAKWHGVARLTGDGKFFEEAYAALSAMQNPWRNATMHLDQKYTLDEAKHIMNVVDGFMKKLASRMDEDGLPLA